MVSSSASSPQFKLFVYIVESPQPNDLYKLRMEGRVLCEALGIAGVQVRYRLATTRELFERSLGPDLIAAMKELNANPILHISAHGNQDGLVLHDGTHMKWPLLREMLVPINFDKRLVVSLSACFGAIGSAMAMEENGPLPFYAIVGHGETAAWADAAIGYAAFYHRLFKGASFGDSLSAMRAASGDDRFVIQFGQTAQDNWVKHMETQRAQEAIGILAEFLRRNPSEIVTASTPGTVVSERSQA